MAERDIEFGAELRRRRKAAGLSQRELAERVPCDKSWISRLEKGTERASPETLQRIDTALEAGGALMTFAPRTGPHNILVGLPPVSTHFVGRSRERSDIDAFLRGRTPPNMCVLTGPAGAGKTSLAVRAAWDASELFPDGCLYLDFHSHTPGASPLTCGDALRILLSLLKVPEEEIPPGDAGLAAVYQNALRGRRLLLIFDDVASSHQIRDLLSAEGMCRVLVTGRNRLNSLDAVTVRVGPLEAAEAAALFRAAGGERAADADDAAVEQIAGHCAGLPLAISIAAARFRSDPVWSAAEFAAELSVEQARLDLLDDGERSLETAFAMSSDALDGAARRLFGLLALHPARRVRVGDAAALAGVSRARARRLLGRLADAHLVTYETADGVVMHDLVREYAGDRVLRETARRERDAAWLRLLDHCLLLTEACGRLLDPRRHRASALAGLSVDEFADRDGALYWIRSQWPVLVDLCHEAAARGLHGECWRLAFALRDYFFLAKLWDPWISSHRAAVECARRADADRETAIALNSLGIAYADKGDLAAAEAQFRQALKLFRALEDEHGRVSALSNLAWTALYTGQFRHALRNLWIVLQAYQRLGNRRNAAITLRAIALAETELGLYRDAVEHALEARREAEELGLPLDVAMSVNCGAWARFQGGDLETAEAEYQTAVNLAERCGSRYETARAVTGLGNVAALTGRIGEAAERWARADALHASLEPAVIGEARVRSTLWLGGEAPGLPAGRRD